MEAGDDEYVTEDAAYVDVCVGVSQWKVPDGRYWIEKDFSVAGEVWRVHKYDVDPYPSSPHSDCVGGRQRYIGYTLHLGTAELYEKRKALGLYLDDKQFLRLIELIRPKFPDIALPIPTP